jgi:uncharacterized RDD family membrane protein YckC
MAQGVSGPLVALEVHVTGRRTLATIVDALVFSVIFWALALLFGGTSAEGGSVAFSLGGLGSLLYIVVVFRLLRFARRVSGSDPR